MISSEKQLVEIFPSCRRIIGAESWQQIHGILDPSSFPEILASQLKSLDLAPWLPDLARLEYAIYYAATLRDELGNVPKEISHNPTLSIVQSGWTGLVEMLGQIVSADKQPIPGKDIILVWLKQSDSEPLIRTATGDELLALKIVVEGLDRKEIANANQTSLANIDKAIYLAVAQGLLLTPPSSLMRDSTVFDGGQKIPEKFLIARTFTLQWHLTQACDLHCKHCYDRSSIGDLSLADAETALDQFYHFCQDHHVDGQVSFTGGNPLLHPQFLEIYREATERGFLAAILGNPSTPERLAEICAIQKPEFFQVSLEGLVEHNDFIRGEGHFQRILAFLDYLREAGIYSMVMLTLTRKNLDQVLPLAELLRGKTDMFTFNRLSMVGEGAQLLTPNREEYESFLEDYLAASASNPVMGLKDNLINIIKERRGETLFGGCAGFGCGAAFNFVALLPDGGVHACRKFHSPIGNIHQQSLSDILDSADARRYRLGPEECNGCRIRHVCGGCLAVISSQGLDISKDRDRCCFLEQPN